MYSDIFFFQAKGISVESFLRTQAELMEKFDSGFSGYRGLSGKCPQTFDLLRKYTINTRRIRPASEVPIGHYDLTVSL